MKTAFASDTRFMDHDTGIGHPERPARLSHTLAHLQSKPWFPSLHMMSGVACNLDQISSMHDEGLIHRAQTSCAQGLSYLD